jgi:hypothetical protein
MNQNSSYWLWYPGDFELYHALKQNFSRVERGYGWPAFWKSSGFRQRVVFGRHYTIEEETAFTVYAVKGAVGYVSLNGEKHPFNKTIRCPKGEAKVHIHVGCIGCVPCAYVEGEIIRSDGAWTVHDYESEPVKAAFNRYFTSPDRDPSEWEYSERLYEPVAVEETNGGVLYTFETELTAAVHIAPKHTKEYPATVYLGESRAEALDTTNCYYYCSPDANGFCPRAAVRCAFIPDCAADDYTVTAVHQYINIPVRASFKCDDEELNRIFDTAAHTFMLCSQIFFLDGVKRDKWIWSGDAYQSLFTNRCLTADAEIEKRTLIALRGGDPVTTHINTILDYSMLWVLSIAVYYDSYADREFVDWIFPKMESIVNLCMAQRDENGFVVGREKDWVFIDWADFDRDGALCAEQMLLYQCYRVMARFGDTEKKKRYQKEADTLLANIDKYFWDEEKGAYIDSHTSGRRQVTRHANIFAILFGVASQGRRSRILRTVLQNDAIPPITTPYFRFFELEALCRMGCLEQVLREIKSYWGGMLKMGAVTFWEEYDPSKPPEEQYAMYGDPFGKSLCHAWAASPIYLLARYFVGLKALTPGGGEYELKPQLRFFRSLDCTFPMGQRLIHITYINGVLKTEETNAAQIGS